MTTVKFNEVAACEFLEKAVKLISEGRSESPIRHNLSAYLPQIFPDVPWWVKEHAEHAEANAIFHKSGKKSWGFVDTLVGATAIEYEKDISKPNIFKTAFGQVEDYCADLLNSGTPPDLIIGVVSDTVRWKAYRVSEVKSLSDVEGAQVYGREHVTLEEIDSCDLSVAGIPEGRSLRVFLEKHLGRIGARYLKASSLSSDLGFRSDFSARHLSAISGLVDLAFESTPVYAELIERLWTDFVSYVGGEPIDEGFDRSTYVGELYILTLAKLICANIISKKGLSSNDSELTSILNGSFFQNRGLSNLVEYDYFGWLNAKPHVAGLLPVAKAIQNDLIVYDFVSEPAEDIFGELMSQLAMRSQRILLGQEWTPAWLAEALVTNTLTNIPDGQEPRLLDMCCGSGAMIVEAVTQTKQKLLAEGAVAGSPEALSKLSNTITGFDVDPLAVILAKIGWVLAARDWLNPAISTTIPIYHADSLFAATPLTKTVDHFGASHHEMQLDDKNIALPAFLISPDKQSLFDLLLDRGYGLAMASAQSKKSVVTSKEIDRAVAGIVASSGCLITQDESALLSEFATQLISAIEELQRAGRNGIWAFVLRNSYRPALVTNKFNGIVSNPPWLALSKIASNPYTEVLKRKAEAYAIKPPGPAHLHVEMATIFLLHSVENYLVDGSAFGCVLPESVLSAHHHTPFRNASYSTAPRPVQLRVNEIWRIKKGTFKNEGIVLFGIKDTPDKGDISGYEISPDEKINVTFKRIIKGTRSAWSNNESLGLNGSGFFNPAPFRQGADIMPRTLVFHSFKASSAKGLWDVQPIDSTSAERYLKADAKTYKTFSLTMNGLSNTVIVNVLLSHHLTPFGIGQGAKGILPIKRNSAGEWRPMELTEVALEGTPTVNAIESILSTLGDDTTLQSYFERIDTNRKKLLKQTWGDGFLVFMGAGGSNVCSAYAPTSDFQYSKTVIDQTLYWAEVRTEDEAIYLTGLLNSDAVNTVIKEFQPRGQFGERHIHKLPFGVTPPFDGKDPAHLAVVDKTRQLLMDWTSLHATNANAIDDLLEPNNSRLHIRRKKIKEMLRELDSWVAYEDACKAVYCVD